MVIAGFERLYQACKKKPPKSLQLGIHEATERLQVLAALSAADPLAAATEALAQTEPLTEAEPMPNDEAASETQANPVQEQPTGALKRDAPDGCSASTTLLSQPQPLYQLVQTT